MRPLWKLLLFKKGNKKNTNACVQSDWWAENLQMEQGKNGKTRLLSKFTSTPARRSAVIVKCVHSIDSSPRTTGDCGIFRYSVHQKPT